MKKVCFYELQSIGEMSNSVVARFMTRDAAELASCHAQGYGAEIKFVELTIYESAVEFDAKLDLEARKSGLDKLSERERKALGI